MEKTLWSTAVMTLPDPDTCHACDQPIVCEVSVRGLRTN